MSVRKRMWRSSQHAHVTRVAALCTRRVAILILEATFTGKSLCPRIGRSAEVATEHTLIVRGLREGVRVRPSMHTMSSEASLQI